MIPYAPSSKPSETPSFSSHTDELKKALSDRSKMNFIKQKYEDTFQKRPTLNNGMVGPLGEVNL